AEAVVGRAIQVVEQRRCLAAAFTTATNERVEPVSMCVESLGAVFHADADSKPSFQPSIKIDDVGIEIVEERPLRQQTERRRETAAKRLHQATMRVRLP